MKIRAMFVWLVVFGVFVLPAGGQTSAGPQLVSIKAGRVVDPETGKTAANQIILVEGKKIKEIGSNVTIPTDPKIIHLSKSTLLPGLFDAPTHLRMTVLPKPDPGNHSFTTLLNPTA